MNIFIIILIILIIASGVGLYFIFKCPNVKNGVVDGNCVITCNPGYNLTGKTCTKSCPDVTNGTNKIDESGNCVVTCNPEYALNTDKTSCIENTFAGCPKNCEDSTCVRDASYGITTCKTCSLNYLNTVGGRCALLKSACPIKDILKQIGTSDSTYLNQTCQRRYDLNNNLVLDNNDSCGIIKGASKGKVYTCIDGELISK